MPNIVVAEMSCKWRNDWRAREQKWFLTVFVYEPFLISPPYPFRKSERPAVMSLSLHFIHETFQEVRQEEGGINLYISGGVRMGYFREERNSCNYYLVTTLSSTFCRPITCGRERERNQVVELYLPFIRNAQNPQNLLFFWFGLWADGKLKFWFFAAVCLVVKLRRSWSCWSP